MGKKRESILQNGSISLYLWNRKPPFKFSNSLPQEPWIPSDFERGDWVVLSKVFFLSFFSFAKFRDYWKLQFKRS